MDGAAADAFRARFAEAPSQWSRAADAFGSAARAWERFRSELAAAQHQAGIAVARFQAGAAAADRAYAAYSAEADLQNPGRLPVLDDAGVSEMEAAPDARCRPRRARRGCGRRDRRHRRGGLSPDPPTGWDQFVDEAADRVGAHGVELAHVLEGIGDGVDGLVRSARSLNPVDPYNWNHPGRFVDNASAALSGAVDTLAHPLRLVADLVGSGWGSDPARAFGHLLPAAVLVGVLPAGARSVPPASEAKAGESVLAATEDGAAEDGAAEDGGAPTGSRALQPPPRTVSEVGRQPPSLWADPRPTARPFTPKHAPETSPATAAPDDAAAARLQEIGRELRADLDGLAPKKVATPDASDVHHDPERARRARLTRGDRDFSSPHNRHGARKSHLDAHGDLVPANPDGATSIVDHVVGRRSPVKGDSPYSSFTSPGARAAVDFGGHTIEIDVVRLQADIDAGLVHGVEIVPPHRVQAAIQADADRIAGRAVDLWVKKGHAAQAARSYGLDAGATAALRQRIIDMANAQRHHEWMIRGVVPGRYVVGPHSEGRHG